MSEHYNPSGRANWQTEWAIVRCMHWIEGTLSCLIMPICWMGRSQTCRSKHKTVSHIVKPLDTKWNSWTHWREHYELMRVRLSLEYLQNSLGSWSTMYKPCWWVGPSLTPPCGNYETSCSCLHGHPYVQRMYIQTEMFYFCAGGGWSEMSGDRQLTSWAGGCSHHFRISQ